MKELQAEHLGGHAAWHASAAPSWHCSFTAHLVLSVIIATAGV